MNNNPLQMMAQIMQRGVSPEQLITMIGNKNPQLMSQLQQIKQQYPNKSYEDLAKEMYQQRGLDYNQVTSMFRHK